MKRLFQFAKRCILELCWSKGWSSKTAEEQAAFLSNFPEPTDDFVRSYFQYKCHCFFRKPHQIFLMNCVALPLMALHSMQFQKTKVPPELHSDAVFLHTGPDNILPQSLKTEFSSIHQVQNSDSRHYLSKEDLRFLRNLRRRYPFSFFFRYECMKELASYSYIISCYRPKALICVEQGRCSLSFLSAYCEMRGVEHINTMHGSQTFDISLAFLRFNRFYTWDPFFRDLFIALRAAKNQFIVEAPPALRFIQTESTLPPVDYTYYAQDQSPIQEQKIAHFLLHLKGSGAKVAVRPHPLHKDCAQLLMSSDFGFLVEDPAQITIEDSLLRTKHAIALFSTVLLQAYHNGKTAVIDDISAPELYKELKKVCYMHQHMPHKLLSQVLEQVCNDSSSNQ